MTGNELKTDQIEAIEHYYFKLLSDKRRRRDMKTKWPKRIDKVPLAERLLYYLPRMLSNSCCSCLSFGASYVFKVYGPYSLETATGFMRSVYQAVVSYYFVFAVGGGYPCHTIWESLFADREELELIIAPSRKPKPKTAAWAQQADLPA